MCVCVCVICNIIIIIKEGNCKEGKKIINIYFLIYNIIIYIIYLYVLINIINEKFISYDTNSYIIYIYYTLIDLFELSFTKYYLFISKNNLVVYFVTVKMWIQGFNILIF